MMGGILLRYGKSAKGAGRGLGSPLKWLLRDRLEEQVE